MSGSYGLRDADGRIRTVNYVADAHGYRASISTNEPGTDVKQDPAAANFNLGEVSVPAPIALAAPAPVAFAAPAMLAKPFGGPLVASSYGLTTQHIATPMVANYGFGVSLKF